MSTASGTGVFDTVAGPDTVDSTAEQLVDWSADLAARSQREQLAEYARPTKPDAGDSHANDPSRTTTIQRRYAQKLRGRFADIATEIRAAVDDRDILGLEDQGDEARVSMSDVLAGFGTPDVAEERYWELLGQERYDAARQMVAQLADFDADELIGREFNFESDARKHEAFMAWLREQQEQGVLEVIARDENTYVRSAYERGYRNATTWVDREDSSPSVSTALNRPVHQDKLELLYERNFEALRGITDDVAREISRTLAEGMAEGTHPTDMARRLTSRVDAIGKTRATTLARTEVMYAHNESLLTTYEDVLGDDTEVEVLTEVSTAGDAHVCDQCSAWEGVTLSIDDARNEGPPFHPRCRCILLPTTNRNSDAVKRIGASTGAAAVG